MTPDQFDRAYRGFSARRPFRTFLIEFFGGIRLQVSHPEAVRRKGDLYVVRRPDGGSEVLAASGICRLLDPPSETAAG
jgi:hypothetical protein